MPQVSAIDLEIRALEMRWSHHSGVFGSFRISTNRFRWLLANETTCMNDCYHICPVLFSIFFPFLKDYVHIFFLFIFDVFALNRSMSNSFSEKNYLQLQCLLPWCNCSSQKRGMLPHQLYLTKLQRGKVSIIQPKIKNNSE